MTLCGKIVSECNIIALHDMTQSANEPASQPATSAMEYGQDWQVGKHIFNLFHVAIHGDYFNPYRIECFDGAELLARCFPSYG